MSLQLHPRATPDVTLAALPEDLRAIAQRLGAAGLMLAGDLYNLRHIAGRGGYEVGIADGSYLTMALTSIGAAAVRKEISVDEHDSLQAYALQASKRAV